MSANQKGSAHLKHTHMFSQLFLSVWRVMRVILLLLVFDLEICCWSGMLCIHILSDSESGLCFLLNVWAWSDGFFVTIVVNIRGREFHRIMNILSYHTHTHTHTSTSSGKFSLQSVLAVALQPTVLCGNGYYSDSAPQIGPETTLKGFLILVGTVGWKICSPEWKFSLRGDFANSGRTRGGMDK